MFNYKWKNDFGYFNPVQMMDYYNSDDFNYADRLSIKQYINGFKEYLAKIINYCEKYSNYETDNLRSLYYKTKELLKNIDFYNKNEINYALNDLKTEYSNSSNEMILKNQIKTDLIISLSNLSRYIDNALFITIK